MRLVSDVKPSPRGPVDDAHVDVYELLLFPEYLSDSQILGGNVVGAAHEHLDVVGENESGLVHRGCRYRLDPPPQLWTQTGDDRECILELL